MNLDYPFNGRYSGFERIQVIKCRQALVLIGWDCYQTEYYWVNVHKTRAMEPLKPLSDILEEGGPYPSYDICKKQAFSAHPDYQERESVLASALVGFYRFHQGYYLLYVVESSIVAKIGSHEVYKVDVSEVLPLFEIRSDTTKKEENNYSSMLKEFKMEHFYFSPSYDLTNTLGKNIIRSSQSELNLHTVAMEEQPPKKKGTGHENIEGMCQMFQYNYEAMKQFDSIVKCKRWIVTLIHGYCRQINTKVEGNFFNVIVLARRSRHHAGARYLKRGLSANGHPANHVQIEQIVVNHSAAAKLVASSYLQVRASVPTYWVQRPSIAIPKPAIETKQEDYLFLGTRKHFSDLIARHGTPIYCVNLMRTKEKTARESNLSDEFAKALVFINGHDLPQCSSIHYIPLDMKYFLKLDKKLFVEKGKTLAYYTLPRTGIFLYDAETNELEMQGGVIRTNCVDCLDRTNSFQQLIGETALAFQIRRLLRLPIKYQSLTLDHSLESEYAQLYEQMGDLLSMQYGSSLAHKQKIQKSVENRFQFFTAITRHVNNNFKDEDRQKQIDLFLGFKASESKIALWDIKPCIDHCPLPALSQFDNPLWFAEACSLFERDNYIKQLRTLFPKYECSIALISKKHLLDTFVADVVANIINEKEVNTILRVKVDKAQKITSPKAYPKEIKSLREEVQICYNINDFYEERRQGEAVSPAKKNKMLDMPMVIPKAFYIPQENEEFINDIDQYLKAEILDDKEIKKMERYLRGDIGGGSDTSEDDVLDDEVIQMELVHTQALLKSNRMYCLSEGQNEAINLGSSTKINEREKKWVLKDNKVRVIQNILLKNFSQGTVQKIRLGVQDH